MSLVLNPRQSAGGGSDWRTSIPADRRRALRHWYLTGALLTFVIIVIGGITRLTQSGLSIVDWAPIMGVLPPMGEIEWQEAFDKYRQFPEYQKLRVGMTMNEFKFIYFWEWFHRLFARMIGLVFLIPFVYFWLRGYFNRPLFRRSLLLFGLGAGQGLMGWFMVMSGLVDNPSVSHYRLAAHFSLALAIFSYCLWLAADMRDPESRLIMPESGESVRRGPIYLLGALLGLQVIWGAFVAGLNAGFYFNTFPLMGGKLIPPFLLGMEPPLINFFENPIAVQWVHRVIGTVLLGTAIVVAVQAWRNATRDYRIYSGLFAGLTLVQYGLGIATLVLIVPIPLGVAHQAVAVLILGVWIRWLHYSRHTAYG